MADATPSHAGMPPSYEGGGPAMLPAAQHHGHNPGHGGVTTTPRLPTIAATSSLPLASATANTILSQVQSFKGYASSNFPEQSKCHGNATVYFASST